MYAATSYEILFITLVAIDKYMQQHKHLPPTIMVMVTTMAINPSTSIIAF
jgi:hypothetical protein